MKKTKKKLFLMLLGFTVVAIVSFIPKESQRQFISCAPMSQNMFASLQTVQDGSWNDPATWGGVIPTPSDSVVVNHNVTLSSNTSVSGLIVNGNLQFDPNSNVILSSSKNILIYGNLKASPSTTVKQCIRFTGINENNYIGGGMDPLPSDIGLWVVGSGQVDIQGSSKTGWTNSIGGINQATNTLFVKNATNWKVGDTIVITPTANNSDVFEEKVITGINGNSITVNSNFTTSHPSVKNWSPEVLNLTRNFMIEGTSTGKSHMFIRSTKSQTIKYVRYRWMGPRKDVNGDGIKDLSHGRYGIHFHHNMDNSIGSILEGNVMWQVDNHSYVTHVSNGITVKNCISYDVTETPYWWDMGDVEASHSITWDGNVAAKTKYVYRSLLDPTGTDIQIASIAFLIGAGDDNVAINNVAVGTYGDDRTGGGFKWEANNEGMWDFLNNLSHNCNTGLISWQNTDNFHIIDTFYSYNCGMGIFQGAYLNSFRFNGGDFYNSPIYLHAGSATSRLSIENYSIDMGGGKNGIIIEGSPLPAAIPVLIRNTTVSNTTGFGILDNISSNIHSVDVLQSNSTISNISTLSGEIVRVQPVSGQPYVIKGGDVISNINTFAPSVWGNGQGLSGTYYNNPDFTGYVFTRVDGRIGFGEWNNGVHHKITDKTMSVRWVGKIMAQSSEPYKFQISSAGSHKMWVNGALVINNNSNWSSPINLVYGTSYDVVIEFTNNDTDLSGGINLYWTSPLIELYEPGGQYVPQSQMYPSGSTPTPPSPTAPLSFTTSNVNVTSCTPNGSITISTNGGKSPYQYSKDNGANWQTSNLFNGLTTGSYSIKVKDDSNSVASSSVLITDNGSDQYETNNTRATAKTIVTESKVTARIGISGDVDWYKVVTPAGSNGTYYLLFSQISAVSQTFELTNSGGTVITPISSGTIGTTKYTQYSLVQNTSYYMRVRGTNNLSCYDIKLTKTLPITGVFSVGNIENGSMTIETTSKHQVITKLIVPTVIKDEFTIQSPYNEKIVYYILNTYGQMIKTGIVYHGVNSIFATGLPKDMYIISIVNPNTQARSTFRVFKR